jgi:hypothetical protein
MIYSSIHPNIAMKITDIALFVVIGFLIFLIELYKPAIDNIATIIIKKLIIVDIIKKLDELN